MTKSISEKITVGYNRCGQEFFDYFKDKNIHSVFFSPTHNGYNTRYDSEEFMKEFLQLDTYNLPMNLILNTYPDEKVWDELISLYKPLCNMTAVTCLTTDVAEKIKEKYPDFQIHLSVQAANITPYKKCDIFDYININGAFNFNKDTIEKFRKHTKIKFIANEGCIVGRAKNFCNFDVYGMFTPKCCNGVCHKIEELYPWLALARINIFKEFLDYVDIDLIKFASREVSMPDIKKMYEYWTSPEKTQYINGIEIKNYDAYLKWIEQRLHNCNYDCVKCRACEKLYKEIKGL